MIINNWCIMGKLQRWMWKLWEALGMHCLDKYMKVWRSEELQMWWIPSLSTTNKPLTECTKRLTMDKCDVCDENIGCKNHPIFHKCQFYLVVLSVWDLNLLQFYLLSDEGVKPKHVIQVLIFANKGWFQYQNNSIKC